MGRGKDIVKDTVDFDTSLDIYVPKEKVRVFPGMKKKDMDKLPKKLKDRLKGKKPKKI